MPGATAAVDEFARSESGRTQCARRVWARDGPQQRQGRIYRVPWKANPLIGSQR